ncbi:MAG: hypothetical protein ACJ8C4_18080 [Gemmataceae bacterium]
MANHLVCPHCGEHLRLRHPASDGTIIKCGLCRGKLFGNGTPVANTSSVSDDTKVSQPQPLVAERPRRRKQKSVEHDSDEYPVATPELPRWLAPVGLTALVAIALAGFMWNQGAPPPAPAGLHNNGAESNHTTVNKQPIEPANVAKALSAEVPRPASLIGSWSLQEPAGGTIELTADGDARVNAPLLNDKPLLFTSRWFVVAKDGDIYDLELGTEPLRTGNHRLRVELTDENTLRLIKYSNTADLNVRVRTFIKRK